MRTGDTEGVVVETCKGIGDIEAVLAEICRDLASLTLVSLELTREEIFRHGGASEDPPRSGALMCAAV